MSALDRLREQLNPDKGGFVSFAVDQPPIHGNLEPRARAHAAEQESSSEQLTNYLKNKDSTPGHHRESTPGQHRDAVTFGGLGTRKTDRTLPRWIDRPNVVTVVEDLAAEGWRPGRIARELGLTRAEVLTILKRMASKSVPAAPADDHHQPAHGPDGHEHPCKGRICKPA
jgi:hypothetical protein